MKHQKEFDEWRAQTQLYHLNPEKHEYSVCEHCLESAKTAWSACEQVMQKEIDELNSRSCETCVHSEDNTSSEVFPKALVCPKLIWSYPLTSDGILVKKDFCCKYWTVREVKDED